MRTTRSQIRRKGLWGLLLPTAVMVAGIAALAAPSRAATITFNPFGTGTGANAITGVTGFGFATTSVLASGISGPPATVGATSAPFNVYYESVINATQGTGSTVNGTTYSINSSPQQFTVIAGFQETVTNNGGGSLTLNLVPSSGFSTSLTAPNFFEIFAQTAGTVNPTAGTGTGFGNGTLLLSGNIVPGLFAGGFNENLAAGTSTPLYTANPPNLTSLIPTGTTTVAGSGSTTIQVQVNSITATGAGYFPTGLAGLLFSTTNSLPFTTATVPLSGFWSGAATGPDINYSTSGNGPPPGNTTTPLTFNPGTINAVNGNSLMFQSVAQAGILVPEPSSIIPAATAAMGIPTFVWFWRRRPRKTVA